MTKRKYSVMFSFFSYGGNGGFMSEHPDVRVWMQKTLPKARADSRVGEILLPDDFADTPITMARNNAVMVARQEKADFLIMCDSDMQPDMYLKEDASAVPFWDAAFDFCAKHYDKGPHVVGVPYCGPPAYMENVYVFQWLNRISNNPDDSDFKLDQYTRAEASRMSGIHPCGALPTGLIMYDMRAFDLIEPCPDDAAEQIVAEMGLDRDRRSFTRDEMFSLVQRILSAKQDLSRPFFYYEYGGRWGAKYEAEKGSTEDVTNTRDISLAGLWKLGYNPLHCAWSSWAGHWKPKCVGKPMMLTAECVGDKLRAAALRGMSGREQCVYIDTPIAEELCTPNHNGHVHALAIAE